MQPTFIPWMGFFALMHLANDFVFLDDVQFSKQSWQSRNRIKGPNGVVMLSLAVSRDVSKPLIADVALAGNGFERKLLNSVRGALGKAPYFALVEDILGRAFAIAQPGSMGSLARLNIAIINDVARVLGLTMRCHRASELGFPEGEKSARLLRFAEHFGSKTYLSPAGSSGYLAKANPFEGSATSLRFINFTHPVYSQGKGAFLSHMGIIDALAHIGPDATAAAIAAGIGPSQKLSDLQATSEDFSDDTGASS